MRFLVFIFVITISSCSLIEKDNEEQIVARVEDKQLLLSDLDNLVPEGIAKEDSLLIVTNFIQNWVKENLILQKAELNLKQNQKDF